MKSVHTGVDMAELEKKNSHHLWVIICAVAPFAYILSIGPVAALTTKPH